jgi:hypothetical protein
MWTNVKIMYEHQKTLKKHKKASSEEQHKSGRSLQAGSLFIAYSSVI